MARSSAHIAARHGNSVGIVGKVIYVVAVAEPLANLPQIFTIYIHRNATGVSVTSWLPLRGICSHLALVRAKNTPAADVNSGDFIWTH